ncbi:MAG TPA: hypothetical protein VMW35_02120 [Myxococcota bacterium]|jgi:hypothetical protein|nr:hypothetical protein [Myxococcota bacterium]
MAASIEIGFQVFLTEGGEEVGAVHALSPARGELVVYVENAGDFQVPIAAVRSVHDGKVVLDASRLDEALRRAIAHAHDREDPGL